MTVITSINCMSSRQAAAKNIGRIHNGKKMRCSEFFSSWGTEVKCLQNCTQYHGVHTVVSILLISKRSHCHATRNPLFEIAGVEKILRSFHRAS